MPGELPPLPFGEMPPPAPGVGWIFRILVVTLCLMLSLCGCGLLFSTMKSAMVQSIGYDPNQRRLETMINEVYEDNGKPVPYPRWKTEPTNWMEKVFWP